jgi:hypothetical protein
MPEEILQILETKEKTFENCVMHLKNEKILDNFFPSKFTPFTRYHLIDRIKDDEMDGECGTHGRGKKCVQHFSLNTRREETT